MTTNLWIEQYWYDYKLTWSPDEYGGKFINLNIILTLIVLGFWMKLECGGHDVPAPSRSPRNTIGNQFYSIHLRCAFKTKAVQTAILADFEGGGVPEAYL